MTPGRHVGEWDLFWHSSCKASKDNARLVFYIFKDIFILLWFRCASAAFSVGKRVCYNSGHETPASPEN